ncbi:MAG: zinc metallopeptidase [Isosphaeraceae bacterium]
MRRYVPWFVVVATWAVLAGVTAFLAIDQYEQLASGWSWDLAYYNQWFWALTQGQGQLSVRPIGPFTQEGPSIWTMNYLTPARLLIAPIYAALPGPRTLLVVQAVILWLLVPAVYGLVREESGSIAAGLAAVALLPLTPLIWPLALNDFRELQLAPPFIVWAVHGVRARRVGLAALGVGGLLACRQEFALMVASLAILSPATPESADRRARWARVLWLVGLGWLFFGFFGYMRWCVNYRVLSQLTNSVGSSATLGWRIETAWGLLTLGAAAWTACALLRPRAFLLVLPWVWGPTSGLFRLEQVETIHWHHVRYAAPMIGMLIAIGSLGFAWLARRLLDRSQPIRLILIGFVLALGSAGATWNLLRQFERRPEVIPVREVGEIRAWLGRVEPEAGVLAHYKVSAPLSSRPWLYSYVMDQNKPPGYPLLDPGITWLFVDRRFNRSGVETQGFIPVFEGESLSVFRRSPSTPRRGTLEEASSLGTQLRWPRAGMLAWVRAWLAGPSSELWDNALGISYLLVLDVVITALALAPWVVLRNAWRRRTGQTTQVQGSIDLRATAFRLLDEARLPEVGITVPPDGARLRFDRATRSIEIPEPLARSASTWGIAALAVAVAHAVETSRAAWRGALREALEIGVSVGKATGVLLIAAGMALVSANVIQLGAATVSVVTLLGFVGLSLLERPSLQLARTLIERTEACDSTLRGPAIEAVAMLGAWQSVGSPDAGLPRTATEPETGPAGSADQG